MQVCDFNPFFEKKKYNKKEMSPKDLKFIFHGNGCAFSYILQFFVHQHIRPVQGDALWSQDTTKYSHFSKHKQTKESEKLTHIKV